MHRDHPRRDPRAGGDLGHTSARGRSSSSATRSASGIPFLILGFLYDRAPGILRPLIRHGRAVSFIGGMLVVAIGVAMVTGWLDLLPRYFNFNTAV